MCSGHSPPGDVGLHHLHHGQRALVDFDEDSAEELAEAEHLDDVADLGADAFDPEEEEEETEAVRNNTSTPRLLNRSVSYSSEEVDLEHCWIKA